MRADRVRRRLGGSLALGLALAAGQAEAERARRPDALVDLRTREGVELVRGNWRYADARIVEVDARGPGPDLRASGAPVRAYDLVPRAGAADFEEASWERIEATELELRRSHGKLGFGWYRIDVTVPERVGAFDPTGSTMHFEIVVDDYAEVWVDGKLPRALGQRGGSLVAGFNAPNRVVVSRDARPGARHRIAVFAANGPLSDPPANFLWVRSAVLVFHRPAEAPVGEPLEVVRLDPGLDAIVPQEPRFERLAGGFTFTEGPVWTPDGALLFSDPNENAIYRWSEFDGVSISRPNSGYTGFDVGTYRQPGSNGLALDAEGRLTICEHGNRRVTRLERNGTLTVLADRYRGKRLNSPNDLVYRSDGTLYFTDPPFGLPGFHDDPRREQPHFGVYRLRDGALTLESTELTGPNGIAFSPDERFLYVANWEPERKVVLRHPVKADGSLGRGRLFFDLTGEPGEEALDGLEVDREGNLYVSGPGGLWIVSPSGKALGTVRTPQPAANFAWGDDGRTLYLAARSELYRIRLLVPGHEPFADAPSASR